MSAGGSDSDELQEMVGLARGVGDIKVDICLFTEDDTQFRRILKLSGELLDLLGFEGPLDVPIKHGRFVFSSNAKAIVRVKRELTSSEVEGRLSSLAEAVRFHNLNDETYEESGLAAIYSKLVESFKVVHKKDPPAFNRVIETDKYGYIRLTGTLTDEEEHVLVLRFKSSGNVVLKRYNRPRRRRWAWAVAASLVAVLAAGLAGLSITRVGSGHCASQQCKYQAVILKDRSALSPGYILVHDSISIPLGQPYIFGVTACGQHAMSCGSYSLADYSSSKSEPSRFRGKLLVGARILAILEGDDITGSVQALTPEVEPVIASTDKAAWEWLIEPSRGGNYVLNLTLTPLEGDTNSPLVASISLPIHVNVTMTWWQKVYFGPFSSVRNFILGLGGLLGALGISVATVVLLMLRHRKGRSATQKSAPGVDARSSEILAGSVPWCSLLGNPDPLPKSLGQVGADRTDSSRAGDRSPEEHEPDRVGPKIAAGLAVAGAGIALGPGAALILGAASPLFESLAERAWGELSPDARRRDGLMLSTVADAAGCDAEQLGEMIGASEQTRLMTGLAMQAAERTVWPPKVVALGKVLAAGLIASDEAEVDVQQQALAAMTDMDRLHVILLDLLVRYEPDPKHNRFEATLHRVPSYVNVSAAGGGPKVWSPGRRIWTAPQICAARPQLRPVVPTLLGTLQRHGLAAKNDIAPEMLKQLSNNITQQVNRQAGEMQRSRRTEPITLREPTIHDVEPSWSPTELGELVLGFYLEAGIADSPAAS
jgi:hypothetical protein